MSESALIAGYKTAKINREELRLIATPQGTKTHQPVPHIQIVEALIETLGFRHIKVVGDEYAVSPDGMKMFGLLELDYEFTGVRFAIGLRNSNDKSMRLAMTVGYRVMVCENLAFQGDFNPVLAKHSKSFDLIDTIALGVERMQRNFEPLKRNIGEWRANELSDDQAKLILYEAFVEGGLDVSPRLLPTVHHGYFHPELEAFQERTLWSLSNAFTDAFKDLKPFQQYRAASKLSPFLNRFNRPF